MNSMIAEAIRPVRMFLRASRRSIEGVAVYSRASRTIAQNSTAR
jgi:hypothetical protein